MAPPPGSFVGPADAVLPRQASGGTLLVVAERIGELRQWLEREGLGDQFHPSYTRMVPAHHVVEIALVGCPDPNPQYTRYFAPRRNRWPTDLDFLGRRYMTALADACCQWLDVIDPRAPIGVLFSGGIDSGAVFLVDNAQPEVWVRSEFLTGITRDRHAAGPVRGRRRIAALHPD